MTGEGCAAAIAPVGHGFDYRKKIVEPKPFLDALLERP